MGVSSYRARTFYIGKKSNTRGHQALPTLTAMFPFRSDWTTPKAVEPRRSQAGAYSMGEGEICKSRHTEKAYEAFRSTQEGEGVDACIGDGDVCKRLIRGSEGRIGKDRRDKTDGNSVKIGCHRVKTCRRPSLSRRWPLHLLRNLILYDLISGMIIVLDCHHAAPRRFIFAPDLHQYKVAILGTCHIEPRSSP